MLIHEAIQTARDNPYGGMYIRRKSWPYNSRSHTGDKIRATNAPHGCILLSTDFKPERWMPTAEDLIADDWAVCF